MVRFWNPFVLVICASFAALNVSFHTSTKSISTKTSAFSARRQLPLHLWKGVIESTESYISHASSSQLHATEDSEIAVSSLKAKAIDLSRNQASLLLLFISAVYGSNYTAIKTMDEAGLDPFFSAFLRFLIATSVLLPSVISIIKESRVDILLGGMEVGLLNALGYLFQAVALKQVDSSTATVAFVASLSCITVPIFDLILPKMDDEQDDMGPKSKSRFTSALLALAGVACLELYGVKGASITSASNIAALAQPLFFGLAFWRLEKLIKRCSTNQHLRAFTGGNQLSVLVVAGGWFLASTLSRLPTPLIADVNASFDPSLAVKFVIERIQEQSPMLSLPTVLKALAWTGLVTTAGAALCETYAMKKLTAAEVSIIYTTEPLWGTAFAAFYLGETVGLNTLAGGLLITLAVLVSTKSQTRAEA